MKRLVRYALFSDFRSVTARKECEFGIGKPRPYNLQQRKTRAPVKFEPSLEWLSCLKHSVACEVGKPTTSEALDYGSGGGVTFPAKRLPRLAITCVNALATTS